MAKLPHSNSNLSNVHFPSRLIHGILFLQATLLLFFSTCIFHIFLGHPCFLLPFTSNSNTFLKTCPSSLLNTCPYHLTPFTFAIWTAVSFNPNISIRSSSYEVNIIYLIYNNLIRLASATNYWTQRILPVQTSRSLGWNLIELTASNRTLIFNEKLIGILFLTTMHNYMSSKVHIKIKLIITNSFLKNVLRASTNNYKIKSFQVWKHLCSLW